MRLCMQEDILGSILAPLYLSIHLLQKSVQQSVTFVYHRSARTSLCDHSASPHQVYVWALYNTNSLYPLHYFLLFAMFLCTIHAKLITVK